MEGCEHKAFYLQNMFYTVKRENRVRSYHNMSDNVLWKMVWSIAGQFVLNVSTVVIIVLHAKLGDSPTNVVITYVD